MNVWMPDELSRFLRYAENYRAGVLGPSRGDDRDASWRTRRAAMGHGRPPTLDGQGARRCHVPRRCRDDRRAEDEAQPTDDRPRSADRVRHEATPCDAARELFELGVTSPTDDRVFANEIGEPMRPHSVGQAFNRLVESSGIPRIRLHDLRHTHASHLLAAGVNAKVVSERLGHASVSFTLDTYGHVVPGQQSEAAEAAAALLSW